jgi:hypothetical protein
MSAYYNRNHSIFGSCRALYGEGLLHYPIDYKPGTKYPLVLMIHGGPFESDKDHWAFGRRAGCITAVSAKCRYNVRTCRRLDAST